MPLRAPRSFAVCRRWVAAAIVAACALDAAADNQKVALGINTVLSNAQGIYRPMSESMLVVLLYNRGTEQGAVDLNEKQAIDLKGKIDKVAKDKDIKISTVLVALSGADRYRSQILGATQPRRPSAFVAVDLWADAVGDLEEVAREKGILTISTRRIDVDQKKLSVAVLDRTLIYKSSDHLKSERVQLNIGEEIRPDSRRDGLWIDEYSEGRVIARRKPKNVSDWEAAVRHYRQAMRHRSLEQRRSVPLDGKFTEQGYLPHFYLGEALFELKQYDAALNELLESERQRVILEYPDLTRQLHELKKRCIDRGGR